MQLAHKIELRPTLSQENYFRQACGIARFAWNWGLAEWQRQYEVGQKPSGFALKKKFNQLKEKEFPWVYEVTKYACQQPFIYLQQAFSRFFQRIAHYPRFKKKGISDSFYIGNDHIQIEGDKIRLPKLGWVKMHENLRFSGKIVSATISRVAHRWFVSVQIACGEFFLPCKSQAKVGIDLGIQSLATLYDGKLIKSVEGVKPLARLLKKLKRLQRQWSGKSKGSQNCKKARKKVAILHYRIRCLRQDSLHKLTTFLTQTYKEIVIEDLNVKGMMANRRLARSLADASFYEFRRQLNYKAQLRGNNIITVGRWFPSSKRCSHCHTINENLPLSDRIFHCSYCHFESDRDANAAINLYQSTASSAGFEVCGEEGSGFKAYA